MDKARHRHIVKPGQGNVAGHLHAGVTQIADHLPQGGVLASHLGYVGHLQVFEPDDLWMSWVLSVAAAARGMIHELIPPNHGGS